MTYAINDRRSKRTAPRSALARALQAGPERWARRLPYRNQTPLPNGFEHRKRYLERVPSKRRDHRAAPEP